MIIGLIAIICVNNWMQPASIMDGNNSMFVIVPMIGAYIYAIKRVKAEEGRKQFGLGKEDGRSETAREYIAKMEIKSLPLKEWEKLRKEYKMWKKKSTNHVQSIEEFYHLRNAWGIDQLLNENRGEDKISKMSTIELNLFESAYDLYLRRKNKDGGSFHKERFVLEPEYKKYLKKAKKMRSAKYLGSQEFRDELKNAPTHRGNS